MKSTIVPSSMRELEILGAKVAMMTLIRHWPSSDEDLAAWDRLVEKAQQAQTNPMGAAVELSTPLTPGLWLLALGNAIYNLEQTPTWYFDDLLLYYRLLPSQHDERIGREIRAACAAALALKQLSDTPDDSPFPVKACEALVAFTELFPASEYEHCHDILLLAVAKNLVYFGNYLTVDSDLDFWQRATSLYDKVARAGGKPVQVAIGAMSTAIVSMTQADRDAGFQFQAFRVCEIAVERLRVLVEGARQSIHEGFLHALLQRRFTWPLLVYFVHDAHAFPRRDELLAVVGAEPWPQRVRRLTNEAYVNGISRQLDLFRLEFEIDNHRYELERTAPKPSLAVEWTNWRFEHNAYRRAVPHSRSLLRERNFNSIVLDFVHEVTHVLSLIGGLGLAACTYRVAALYAAFRVWEWAGTLIPVDALPATHGLPDLKPGHAEELPAVMSLLAPLENARILQDIWTPWFEGVAVFAESASDPAGDATTINDVFLLVRNLVDFYSRGENSDEVMREIEAFQAEFEHRVSKVIHSDSGDRLRMFFAAQDSTYLAGYLIVRAIVTQWRRSAGNPLGGGKCLQLLLHATRYLTIRVLPDLSLPAAEFKEAAFASWLRFVGILIKLPGEDINAFNSHVDPAAPGRLVRWVDGRLMETEVGSDIARASEVEVVGIVDRLRAEAAKLAEKSLAGEAPDVSTTAIGQAATAYLEFAKTRENITSRRAFELINSLMHRMSVLPIGAADARFYLNLVIDADFGRIDLALRTTETHVESGAPSMNVASWTIPIADAELIAKQYATRGEPTMQVSRVVDVGAFGKSGNDNRFAQLYWLRYGDWKSIQALNPLAKALLDSIPDKTGITEDISARLNPSSIHQFEQELADGHLLAKKVLNWLESSTNWKVLDFSIENDALLNRIREAASFLTERSARVDMQHAASRAGLSAIFSDAPWIEKVLSTGYDTLTIDFAHLRQKLAEAMAASGRAPIVSAFLDASSADISLRLPIFIKTRFGWDIGPARLAEECAT
jgi:hypothetical protein